ncbi:hypothetical protein OTU49_012436, partial [Cherax quadricarinatus]
MEGSTGVFRLLLLLGVVLLPQEVQARAPIKALLNVCENLTCGSPNALYAHPTYCTQYVHCINGFPYVKTCPSELHFNAGKGSCDLPEEAQCVPFQESCQLESPYVADGATDGLVVCDCGGTCTKPHPYLCNAYYHCDAEGVDHYTECPGTLVYNTQEEQCDLPEKTQCSEPSTCSCDKCRYPVSDECDAYWQCENGNGVKYYCSSGLLFNRDTSQCDLAVNVDCTAEAWDEGSFTEIACVDRRKDCATIAVKGGCQCTETNCDWQTFILKNCPKACGTCNGEQDVKMARELNTNLIINERSGSQESGISSHDTDENDNSESGSSESGSSESGSNESGSSGSGSSESGSNESGSSGSGSSESGSNESGSSGSESNESGSSGSGSSESGSNESGSSGSGSSESGSTESKTTEAITNQPTTAQPVTNQPTTAQPVTNQPTTAQPVTNQPTTAQPVTNQPTTAQPVTNQPTTAQPATNQPTTAQPVTNQPTTAQPVTNQPTTAQPVTNQPTTAQPVTNQPTTAQPATNQPTTAQPVTNQPTTAQPVTNQPTTAQPVTNQPTTAQPVTNQPTTAQPVTNQPTTPQPVTTQPTTPQSGTTQSSGDVTIDGCVIYCTLGTYHRHPSDCHKFIQCAPYGPQEMPCAAGTVWVQEKLTCDHESISECVTGTYLTPDG